MPDSPLWLVTPLDPHVCAEIVASPRWNVERRASGCVDWCGARTTGGYGHLSIAGKVVRAHRVALVAALGRDLDPSLVADHICRNRLCVNPEHLREVSQRENLAVLAKTHCPRGHALVPENRQRRRDRANGRCRICATRTATEQKRALAAAAAALGIPVTEYKRRYGYSTRLALSMAG